MKNIIILALLSLLVGCTKIKSNKNYPKGIQITGECEKTYNSNIDKKEAVPCAIDPPGYPRLAAFEGIEGYVKFEFDILTNGRAANIMILEAVPERVFERSAKKALKNWIFRVSKEEEKTVVQKKMIYTMKFQFGK